MTEITACSACLLVVIAIVLVVVLSGFSFEEEEEEEEEEEGGLSPFVQCAPGCQRGWSGDGLCDSDCNNYDCSYGGGDCPGH
jgi:hypothetical protein